MTTTASGTFNVNMTPQDTPSENAYIGRLLIDKQFHGDLEAVSQGQMLAHSTAVPDSAGYVAIERVDGTLNGRSGSFVLQHYGISNRGELSLTLTVVPDSGTGELVGLSGSMSINNVEGDHSYTFEYTLAEAL